MLEFYDRDRLFPCYGFGAALGPGSAASHCFPLNGNPHNPEVAGVQGILQAYRWGWGWRGVVWLGVGRQTGTTGGSCPGAAEPWPLPGSPRAQPCPNVGRAALPCRHTLSTVRLSGPTLFAPVINQAAQVGRRAGRRPLPCSPAA